MRSARLDAVPPALHTDTREITDARLQGWRENVGQPVALDLAPAADPPGRSEPDPLVVLSWNVWVGRGRVRELVRRLREGDFVRLGAPADAPLLLLLQEAYRADESVPPTATGAAPRDTHHFHPEEDVVEIARELGLNLRYAPSMRNGSHRSDRGNAILSTLPLEGASAFELPFVVQRRVAVGASLVLPVRGSTHLELRAYSVHLDPFGASRRDWLGVSGRSTQARGLLDGVESHTTTRNGVPVVLGADLNIAGGRREPAYKLLVSAGFHPSVPARRPNWGHTYHMVPRVTIDYLLFRSPKEAIARASVHRLNENPRDAGPFVFGSDHHPLLARVELAREDQ